MVFAGIEMDHDVTAMVVVIEERRFDLIVDGMHLIDVEIAWDREM